MWIKISLVTFSDGYHPQVGDWVFARVARILGLQNEKLVWMHEKRLGVGLKSFHSTVRGFGQDPPKRNSFKD